MIYEHQKNLQHFISFALQIWFRWGQTSSFEWRMAIGNSTLEKQGTPFDIGNYK